MWYAVAVAAVQQQGVVEGTGESRQNSTANFLWRPVGFVRAQQQGVFLSICFSAGIPTTQHDSFAFFGISQGKLAEAESLYKRSLAIDEKVYGPDHPDVATDINNWSLLLEAQVRAVSILQEISCGMHTQVKLQALNNRAGLLKAQVRAVRILQQLSCGAQ